MKEYLGLVGMPYMHDTQFQSLSVNDPTTVRAFALFRTYVISQNLFEYLQVPPAVSPEKIAEDFWSSVPALSTEEDFPMVFGVTPMSFFVAATCDSPKEAKEMYVILLMSPHVLHLKTFRILNSLYLFFAQDEETFRGQNMCWKRGAGWKWQGFFPGTSACRRQKREADYRHAFGGWDA